MQDVPQCHHINNILSISIDSGEQMNQQQDNTMHEHQVPLHDDKKPVNLLIPSG